MPKSGILCVTPVAANAYDSGTFANWLCSLYSCVLCCPLQEQKKLIESMIAEDDKIEGLEHVECKVFK